MNDDFDGYVLNSYFVYYVGDDELVVNDVR